MALTAVYLDLDGVLVDLAAGIANAVGVDRALMYGPRNNHWRGVSDVLTEETGEHWDEDRLLDYLGELGHDFWVGLEKYPWCDELYELCSSFAPTVLMTYPARSPFSASGKMQWIMENLPHAERFSITSCKHHLSRADAVLIDDSVEFCELFRKHKGQTYLFPQPWSDPDGWAERDALSEIRAILQRLSIS